jgi:hypothetical protein
MVRRCGRTFDYRRVRLFSNAQIAISTRFRAPSLAMRLAMCVLHRAERDVQLAGDLVVGAPVGDRRQHLLLAVGERLDRPRRRRRRAGLRERPSAGGR